MARCNLINSVLCCLNPRMCVTPTHYVYGKELAIFTSFAQIENCLTGFTNKCKYLGQECKSKTPVKTFKN